MIWFSVYYPTLLSPLLLDLLSLVVRTQGRERKLGAWGGGGSEQAWPQKTNYGATEVERVISLYGPVETARAQIGKDKMRDKATDHDHPWSSQWGSDS